MLSKARLYVIKERGMRWEIRTLYNAIRPQTIFKYLFYNKKLAGLINQLTEHQMGMKKTGSRNFLSKPTLLLS
jgi:hypothetical protein